MNIDDLGYDEVYEVEANYLQEMKNESKKASGLLNSIKLKYISTIIILIL